MRRKEICWQIRPKWIGIVLSRAENKDRHSLLTHTNFALVNMNDKGNTCKKLKRQEARSLSVVSTFDHDILPTKKDVLLAKSQVSPLLEIGMTFNTMAEASLKAREANEFLGKYIHVRYANDLGTSFKCFNKACKLDIRVSPCQRRVLYHIIDTSQLPIRNFKIKERVLLLTTRNGSNDSIKYSQQSFHLKFRIVTCHFSIYAGNPNPSSSHKSQKNSITKHLWWSWSWSDQD